MKTSKDPNLISLVIGKISNTDCCGDTIVLWDVERNNQKALYEAHETYNILWDHRGQMYILEGENVIDVQQDCAIKAFSF